MKLLLEMTADTIQENPSIAGGVCIFAVAFTLVTANALYGQQGGHPGPIWATRDNMTTQSLNTSVARERPSIRIAPNTLSMDSVPVPVMRPKVSVEPATPPRQYTLTDVQRDLAALGHYEGELDGAYGPQTRQAILRFQQEAGLPQSGEADIALAERLADARQTKEAGFQRAERTPLAAQPVETVEIVSADQSLRDSAIIARIQIGLINFGEDKVAIDGVLGSETEAAIRRFENRYELPVTGKPTAQIIEKMEEIGVLQKS